MANECTYKWNGVEWIRQSSTAGPNCFCPAAHWGPPPVDKTKDAHTITTDAICASGTGDASTIARFASIGGIKEDKDDKTNHKKKMDNFTNLNDQMSELIKKGMQRANIPIDPSSIPSASGPSAP